MTDAGELGEWLTVNEAFPGLRKHFRSKAALHYHLRQRERNGLTNADAVRLSPLGHYLINVPRLTRWAIGEAPSRDAARS